MIYLETGDVKGAFKNRKKQKAAKEYVNQNIEQFKLDWKKYCVH